MLVWLECLIRISRAMGSLHEQRRIEVLDSEVDVADQSYFRLLVDGQSIKYITVEPMIYRPEVWPFGPPIVWTRMQKPNRRPAALEYVRVAELPGVQNTWHATRVDYKDLSIGRKLGAGIYEARSSAVFGEQAIVAKYAHYIGEIGHIERGTIVYQWIDSHGIGPRFLGHLTENGRVIGMLLERITGVRHSVPEDVEICARVLCRLHGLGIRHGDINRFNFLVRGEAAVLLDYAVAGGCNSESLVLIQRELDELPMMLSDPLLLDAKPAGAGGGGLL
ncbi:alpha-galactosidase A precursor [Aspergillus germanicus]